MTLEGFILVGQRFQPVEGRVVVEDGTIQAVEEVPVDTDDIVLPAFVNAHTHLGDSVAKDAGEGLALEELVAPPDGLKHRLLADATVEELVAAMGRSIAFMEATGTAAFIDFREGGADGVKALREAVSGRSIRAMILGRGGPEVLGTADGFGASGAADADFRAERQAAREAGKPFAIHAGEGDPADIEPALDLHPDLLVHMVHAERDHLERVAAREIPIAVCPRSNLVTGVGVPDIDTLREYTTVALGTDNVMLNSPSMFREMATAAQCCDLDPETALHMATRAGYEVAGLAGGIVEVGAPARLLVLDGDSDNLAGTKSPRRAVVHRATAADVKRVVLPAEVE
ncbi:MAG: amidohydrolase family protein [Halodesulfurarchaeum sp.]